MMTTMEDHRLKICAQTGRHKTCKTIKMCDNEFPLFHLCKWIIPTD